MSVPDDKIIADLRDVEAFAEERRRYAWKKLRTYGLLNGALLWVAGLAAGAAGITAIEAPAVLTAAVAFASALSTAVVNPVRSKREHVPIAAAAAPGRSPAKGVGSTARE
jgi:hypothetical protein